MRIVRLALSNIRSYGTGPTVVELGDGITLFWGEIGSGKSTLLSALEFGLFGLGDLRTTHLLRHRAARGEVAVTFVSGAAEYTVHRALVRSPRSGDVRQAEGYIETDGVRTDYSTTELRARVLDLLGFNERPDPKASSRIYRYAVYTPQEEMKQVLSLGREERLDILRRAFGLEQYRHARRNVEEHLVRSLVAPRREVLAGAAAGLPAAVEEEERLRGEADRLAGELAGAGDAVSLIAAEQTRLAEETAALSGVRTRYERARGELDGLERVIGEDAARELALGRDLERLATEWPDDHDGDARFERLRDGHGEWERLVAERTRLRPAADGYRALDEETQALRGAIERERERLAGRREALVGQLAVGEPARHLAALDEEEEVLAAGAARLEAELAPGAELSEEIGLVHQVRGRAQANLRGARNELEAVLGEWAALESLGAGAPCPTCRQTLSPDHLAAIRADVDARAGRLQERIDEQRDLCRRADERLAELGERQDHLERVRRDLEAARGLLERAAGRRRELGERARERAALAAECAALDRRLEAEDYAADERAALDRALERREGLAGDRARFERVEAAIEAIEGAGTVVAYREALARREARAEARRRRQAVEEALAAAAERLRERREEAARRRKALEEQREAVGRLERLEEQITALAERASEAERERVRIQVEEARTRERLAGAAAEHARLLALERRRQYLGEVQRWLTLHLVPAIADIEAEVFERIRARFEALFADWFARFLESDDLEARVDETFSPQLRSGEYDLDLDLDALSGGERTSLALAYRLALSTMVREEAGIHRESLLVLDEPTDGFSSGQLNRLREILNETGCDQTIIVSHEQELEGVADRVYGVVKESGESRVVVL
ncbi:MAG: SMC family ATPase [Methanospirillum sp.]|nr:SMC family ATPase [Methanospirillum sp.]